MYRNGSQLKTQSSPQQQGQTAQTYFVTHDFDGTAELTTTITHALADVSGHDVRDAEFTLYDHVNPEALNRLFDPSGDGTASLTGHLNFTVKGHQVTVYSDGQVAVVPPQQPPHPQR